MSKYFLVNTATNEIENKIEVENLEDYILEDGFILVEELPDNDVMNQFSNVGNEYVNGVFQPKEPLSESWTKNSDGIWNEVLQITDEKYIWSEQQDTWITMQDALTEAGIDSP